MEHSSVPGRSQENRPDPHRQATGSRLPAAGRPPLHPLSGLSILLLDILLFGGESLTLGLAWPVLSLIGFVSGFACTTFFQKVLSRDSIAKSLAKGILAGILVGVPMPIAGTFVGALILSWSGLSFLRNKFFR